MTRFTDHLGFETDLMLIALDGHVVRRDGYWVARHPRLPDYAWGNLLVLDHPPSPADAGVVDDWTARYRGEFASGVRHVALAWHGSRDAEAETAPFITAGFGAVDTVALTTTAPQRPAGANGEVVVRALTTNAHWRDAEALISHLRPNDAPAPAHDAFMARQLRMIRRWCDLGRAVFSAAFDHGALVACLGVVIRPEDGLGRYQFVVTHRAHRGRGICGRLVAEAGERALAECGARRLVIVADHGSSAARIYARVGFDEAARGVGVLLRSPPRRRPVATTPP